MNRMAYFLFKTEPGVYSFDDFLRDKETNWDGVTNPTAVKNLREMKPGTKWIFYHTGDEKAVVGIVEVIGEYRPDPTDETGVFGLVVVQAVKDVPRHVTLAECKANPKLADMVLVKSARLSVQPVTAAEWNRICAMGGAAP